MWCSISDLNTSYPKMFSFFNFPDSIRTNTGVVAFPPPLPEFPSKFATRFTIDSGNRWLNWCYPNSVRVSQHSKRNIMWNQNSKHTYIMRFRFMTSVLMQFLRTNSSSNPRLVTMTWFLNSSVFCIKYEPMPDTAEVYFERWNTLCIRAAPYKELNWQLYH